MKNIWESLKDEEGQGMAEYVLIISLVALAVIVSVALFGTKLLSLYHEINNDLPQ